MSTHEPADDGIGSPLDSGSRQPGSMDEPLHEDIPSFVHDEKLAPEHVERLTQLTMQKLAARPRKKFPVTEAAAAAAALVVISYAAWGSWSGAPAPVPPIDKQQTPTPARQTPVDWPRWDTSRPAELDFEHAAEVVLNESYSEDSRVVAMSRIQMPISNACVELRRIIKEHPEWSEDAQRTLDDLLRLVDTPAASAGVVPGQDGTYSGIVHRLETEAIASLGPEIRRGASDAEAGIQALHKIADQPGRLGISGRHFLNVIRRYVRGALNKRVEYKK